MLASHTLLRPFLFVLALTALAAKAEAQAGEELRVRERANTSRGAPADPSQDENIKTVRGLNVRGEMGEQPPESKREDGAMGRGSASCKVHFDNRTSLHVATYAEGLFRGDVAPWGDLYTYVIGGQTRIYARAGFTDGSVTTWGPRLVACPAGRDFQWMLYN